MKTFVAGHKGMVGTALADKAKSLGHEVLTAEKAALDLRNQAAVFRYLKLTQPDVVIIAAAKVGGIHANATFPADFIYENLTIATNLIEGARQAEIPQLLFLGSSCIYPKLAPQPISEDDLLSGPLESTNEAYALAKIAGLKLCQHYRSQHGLHYHSVMPTNLYGPGDNYHPENSHVIPGLIRKFHEANRSGAKSVEIWGTGKPLREFLHVNDLADACFHVLRLETPPDWVNVGSGKDISILALAELVAKTVGFSGEIRTDPNKPDGTPRKLLDISKILATGWSPKIDLNQGIKQTYLDFCQRLENGSLRQ
jgi:GDP-L-fucose synthase